MTTGFEGCFKVTDIDDAPVNYGNVYERENVQGQDRLLLAPENSCVTLMRELVASLGGPVYLLLILVVPRSQRKPGRYQSRLFSLEEADTFLREFGEFLDRDARQHLWIGTPDRSGLLVWDNHQIVFAYGDLARFVSIAQSMGLVPGKIAIPSPHRHNYHSEFDGDEAEIFNRHEWHWSPLQDGEE